MTPTTASLTNHDYLASALRMPLMLPVPIRLILGAGHVSNYKMNQCVSSRMRMFLLLC